ncbi:retroviral-like aspartic protease family protein [Ancylothrix sp. C2]|nr:retroviral-like aspartic protease family protein [Ancylothrix sp. D3o]
MTFLGAGLALGIGGCNTGMMAENPSSNNTPTAPSTPASVLPAQAKPTAPKPTPQQPASLVNNDPTGEKTYQFALDKAYSAASISQSAASVDDWKLVESRWSEAIALLKSLPASSSQYKAGQGKIKEYQRNATIAKQQAIKAGVAKKPESVRVASGNSGPVVGANSNSNASDASGASPGVSPVRGSSGDVIQVPIKRRAGGTAVIDVTFNNQQTFEMILDTGASGTVITKAMASALNVVPEGVIVASTPSDQAVQFPIGKVRSIEVGGASIQNVTVAIATQLEIGLLGQDFFSQYELTLKESVVEFRPI